MESLQDAPPKNEDEEEENITEEQQIGELMEEIVDDPFSYTKRKQLISLLRHKEYLQDELESERESMAKILTLKEDMWLEWIHDSLSAFSKLSDPEEQLLKANDIANLYDRSVQDFYSVTLWSENIEFIATRNIVEKSMRQTLADTGADTEGVLVPPVEDIMVRAFKATRYCFPDSRRIWSLYLDYLMSLLDNLADEENATDERSRLMEKIESLFLQQLAVAHEGIDDTFSRYSNFVTAYDNANYELRMVSANQIYAKSQPIARQYEMHELKLRQADFSLGAFAEYIQDGHQRLQKLQFKRKKNKKKSFSSEIRETVMAIESLYERAIAIHNDDPLLWTDYVYFLADANESGTEVRSILKRATKTIPHDPRIWVKYLRYLEIGDTVPAQEIALLRLTALSVPEIKSVYDNVKVIISWWLEFAQRHPSELALEGEGEDTDIASSVLEYLHHAFGNEYLHDPEFSIQWAAIQFYSYPNNNNTGLGKPGKAKAQDIWVKLAKTHYKQFGFWFRYFEWTYANIGVADALGLLEHALQVKTLDWPEQCIQLFYRHITEYPTAYAVERASLLLYNVSKQVAARRASEQQGIEQRPISAPPKRKEKDIQEEQPEPEIKRVKTGHDQLTDGHVENTTTGEKQEGPPRNRETRSIVISNLPTSTTENGIRQFFKDCGEILNIVSDKEHKDSAVVEFASDEDVLSALTRDQKKFQSSNGDEEERRVNVSLGVGTTLFVTNYSPLETPDSLEAMFEPFGKVVDVRLPSLKYNTHRRFCYVQLTSPESAQRAVEALDGKITGDDDKLKLVVKISDPNAKAARSSATAEGREVYVKGLDPQLDEHALRKLFGQYGKVEKLRLPVKHVNRGKGPKRNHEGYGFVVFEDAKQAQEAVEKLNMTKIGSRILLVTIAAAKPAQEGGVKGSGDVSVTVFDNNKAEEADNNETKGTSKHDEDDKKSSAREIQSRTIRVTPVSDKISDARLKQLFDKYGEIIKLTRRNDLTENTVFIEYETPQQAAQAVIHLDGTKNSNHITGQGSQVVLHVTARDEVHPATTTTTTTITNNHNNKSRDKQKRLGSSRATTSTNSAEKEESSTPTTKRKPMSNSQFRDIFLKKGE